MSANAPEPPEALFTTLFEASPDAIFVEAQDGTILNVNVAAAQLHQMSRDELIGTSVFDLIPERNRDRAKENFKHWFDKSLHVHEGLSITRDGTQIPVEITGRTIRFKNQEAVLLHVRDISERKNLERQVRESQKLEAVGRLAGGVAHDFNNALTTIMGFVQIAISKSEANPSVQEDLEHVLHAAERAASLTHQLLALGKHQQQSLHPVDLNGVVDKIFGILRRTLGHDIDIVPALEYGIDFIMADESLVEQCLLNLAVNARDAMPHGGSLTIKTYATELIESSLQKHPKGLLGVFSVLEIYDSGEGIDPSIIDKIFDPFFTTQNDSNAGSGLGLSAVYGILEYCGGFIEVDNMKGQGARFKLFFPIFGQNEFIIPQSDTVEVVPPKNMRVLLVEDDDLIRKLVERYLKDEQYEVSIASNGSEGLRAWEQADPPFSLVISDIMMPHLSGTEMVRQMRKKEPNLKVLYISGYSDSLRSIQRHGQEGELLLTKPFSRAQFIEILQSLLSA